MMHWTAPDAVAQAILAFLAQDSPPWVVNS
jgi:hypothetical protein